MWRYFSFSAFITVASVLIVGFSLGFVAALTTLVLIAIEIAFSFDNAVVNAKVLERLPPLWRRLFLTLGVIIAIVGMRILFPLLVVMFSAHLSMHQVINEALHHPSLYARHVTGARDAISAFGGSFLMTLAFYFLFDDNRQELWLKRIERPLQTIGGPLWLPPALVAIIVIIVSFFSNNTTQVLHLGLIGVASYTVLKLFIDWLARLTPSGRKTYVGQAAFLAFIYLEILDAAFSFDSVLGAFAITDKVILIAIGLGVGALWVRNLTVFMVRRGVLKSYIYLEHGAHYAILTLSVALLASIFFDVPDAITGIVGLGVIAASFNTSREVLSEKEELSGD
jgi:hypothetical protein